MKLLVYILLSTSMLAQITKEDIKEILTLQGKTEIEAIVESKELYRLYADKHSYQMKDLALGLFLSSLSGFALGMYESNAFGYNKTGWMPDYLEN